MNLYEFAFKAMGGPCEIKLYAGTEAAAQQAHTEMLDEIRRLEAKYSRYQPDSVTSKINRGAGQSNGVTVDSETVALLNYADQLYQQSDGLFDISSGVLRRAWDFTSNTLPSSDEVIPLLALVGWEKVEIKQNQIRLPKPGMEIDFGGFVKEYAADTTAVIAFNLGIRHGLVNLGGDIRAIGPHPDDSPWRVGIQHPRKVNTPIAQINLHQGGIATSGDYERYMIVNGKRYCHLLNPKSGKSVMPFYASISIVAEACLIAGSFTTIGLLKSEKDSQWISQCGLPHLLIDTSLQISGSVLHAKASNHE